jgi:hypothetical protein
VLTPEVIPQLSIYFDLKQGPILTEGPYAGIPLCDPSIYVPWPVECEDIPSVVRYYKERNYDLESLCSAFLIGPRELYSNPPPIRESCNFTVENLECRVDAPSKMIFMDRQSYDGHAKRYSLQTFADYKRNLGGIDAAFKAWKLLGTTFHSLKDVARFFSK